MKAHTRHRRSFKAIFQVTQGQLVPGRLHYRFYWNKDDGDGDRDNWCYKTRKVNVKLSPSTNQHQPSFLQARCPSCCQTECIRALKEKNEGLNKPWFKVLFLLEKIDSMYVKKRTPGLQPSEFITLTTMLPLLIVLSIHHKFISRKNYPHNHQM